MRDFLSDKKRSLAYLNERINARIFFSPHTFHSIYYIYLFITSTNVYLLSLRLQDQLRKNIFLCTLNISVYNYYYIQTFISMASINYYFRQSMTYKVLLEYISVIDVAYKLLNNNEKLHIDGAIDNI